MLNVRKSASWLNSTIIGVGLASFFSDIGHEMATAAMPALLASLGANSSILGLIEGVSDGVSSGAKFLSGFYSDRIVRRKPLAVAGYLATAVGMASFAWAKRPWQVFVGRAGGWLGRGVRSPIRKTLLAEATTPGTYGRAFGLERAMDSSGAVLGPLLAFFLISRIGLRGVFELTLIPSLLAALALVLFVREKTHAPVSRVSMRSSVNNLPLAFRRYMVGVGTAGLGDFSKALLILWTTQALTPRLGIVSAAKMTMLFYVGYNAIYAVSCYLSGFLADHFLKRRVLALGYALAVIPAAALLMPGSSFLKFAAVFGFSGIYMGVWETVESASAAEMLPSEMRGSGFGALSTVNGIGDLTSSILVGFLWTVSPIFAMIFVIMVSLLGATLIAGSSDTFGSKKLQDAAAL